MANGRVHIALVACCAMAAVAVGGCCDKMKGNECPSSYSDMEGYDTAGTKTCTCSAGAATGSVWGTDVYTTDSSICAAAVHVGLIPATGGEVKVAYSPGCAAYEGSSRNGVVTSNWDSYEGSFYFPDKGDGKCKVAQGSGCPDSFKSIASASTSTKHSCTCLGSQTTGSVWGTGIYTSDSSICAAAVHAGAIPPSGGAITVQGAPGCGSYTGSQSKGISSSDWGTYELSFYFPGHGKGACP